MGVQVASRAAQAVEQSESLRASSRENAGRARHHLVLASACVMLAGPDVGGIMVIFVRMTHVNLLQSFKRANFSDCFPAKIMKKSSDTPE